MAEIIEESITEKEIGIETNEPLTIVSKVLNISSKFGKILKKDDEIYSSKTGYIIKHYLEVKNDLDGVSSIIFSVYIYVEENYVRISLRISLKTELKDDENIFNEYYKNYVQPKLAKKAEKIANNYIFEIKKISS